MRRRRLGKGPRRRGREIHSGSDLPDRPFDLGLSVFEDLGEAYRRQRELHRIVQVILELIQFWPNWHHASLDFDWLFRL